MPLLLSAPRAAHLLLSLPRVAIAWQRGWRRPSPWDCAPAGLSAPRPACLPAGTHGQARQAGQARAGMTAVGRARMTAVGRAGMTKLGHAPSFPDSSPPPGERIKERGDAPRGSRWRQRPPSPSPLPPKGRGRQERAARAGMTAVGRPAPACHPRAWPLRGARLACRDVAPAFLFPVVVTSPFSLPLSSLLPVTLSEAKGLREAICPSAAWRTRLPAPTRQAGRCA